MFESLMSGVAGNAIYGVVTRAGQAVLRWISRSSAVARAIAATEEQFSDSYMGIADALRQWSFSQVFVEILRRHLAGERDLVDEDAIQSFLDTTNFYVEPDPRPIAADVLTAFFAHLTYYRESDEDAVHFRESRAETRHEEVLSRMDEGFARIEARVFQPQLPVEVSGEQIASEKLWHARIDDARNLINEGQFKRAHRMLLEIRSELEGVEISNDVRFRIAANLGACALHLDDLDTAEREYETAFSLKPDSIHASVGLANVALLRGEPAQALALSRNALLLEQCNGDAMAVHLTALYETEGESAVDELLGREKWIADDPSCGQALGRFRYLAGRFAEAETRFRSILSSGDGNPVTHHRLALAIVRQVQRPIFDDPPVPSRLLSIVGERLTEAEGHLTITIDAYQKRDNRHALHEAYISRASVRLMQFRYVEAQDDCNRVLLDEPEGRVADAAREILVRAYVATGRWQEALTTVRDISDPTTQENLAHVIAEAHLGAERPEETLEVLSRLWEGSAELTRNLYLADLKLRAFTALDRRDDAATVLTELRNRYGDHPDVIALIAAQHEREGRSDQAIALLREALDCAAGNQRDRIAVQLADVLATAGQYDEAANLYQPLVGTSPEDPLARRYLVALYHAGRYGEALRFTGQLRDIGVTHPLPLQIEAAILEYVGDLVEAQDRLLTLARSYPERASDAIHAGHLALRRGLRDQARNIAISIRRQDVWDDADALIALAQLRLLLEMDNVLPLAYRARRIAYNNPQIHAAYTAMGIRLEAVGAWPPEPDTVGHDTAVIVARGSEQKTFVLVATAEADRAHRELPVSDPFARKLLGKRVGDEVILPNEPFPDRPFTIKAILSKYSLAARESFASAPTLFPEDSPFQRVPLVPPTEQGAWTILHEHSSRVDATLQLYRQGRLTIGAVGTLVGRSTIEVWRYLVAIDGERVRASGGEQPDRVREIDLLKTRRPVVLDVTALCTISLLRLEDLFQDHFSHLLVPQHVLDEIHEAVDHVPLEYGVLIPLDDGSYGRYEVSEDERKFRREHLEVMRNFVEHYAEIVPANKVLELGRRRFDELKMSLTDGAAAAVLVAQEHSAILYADDLTLRNVSRNDWLISSVWTQSVLTHLRLAGALDESRYRQAVRTLAQAGYTFLSIEAEDVIAALDANLLHPSQVECLLRHLHGPDCTVESAVTVVAELSRRLWAGSFLEQQRITILDLALKALTTGHPARPALRRLARVLPRRFDLMPLQLERVLHELSLWADLHL